MFSGLIGALRIDLGMNSAQFQKGAKQSTSALRKMQKDFDDVAKRLRRAGAAMSLTMTTPLVALAKQSMDLQKIQATAVAQVDAALASMGTAAGFTSDELQKIASQLQGKSLFGDEEILGKVTSNLLTFGNVTGEVFTRAQQMALDMSAALGQDLQGATVMLGKALNDPAQGLTALTRVGVSFTEEQKNVIKAMVEMGDAAGAQQLMLSELEKQYGGQAQALRDLPSGQIQAAMMDIGDAMEQVGAIILPVVADIAGKVSEAALAFQGLSPEVKRFVVIGGAVAATLGPAALAVGGMMAAASALLPVVVAIASPIGIMVAGFAAVAVGVGYAAIRMKGAIDRVGGFGIALDLVKDIAAEVFDRIGDGGTILQNRMSIAFKAIQAGFLKMVLELQRSWANFLHGVKDQLVDVPGMESALLAVGTAAIKAGSAVYETQLVLDTVQGEVAGLEATNAELAAGITAPLASVQTLKDALQKTYDTGAAGAEDLQTATTGVTTALDDAGTAVEDLGDKLDESGTRGGAAIDKVKDKVKDLAAETDLLGSAMQSALSSLSSGDISGAFSNLKSGIGSAASTSFGNLLTSSFGAKGTGFSGLASSLGDAFTSVTKALSGIGGGIVSSLGAIGTAVSAALPIIGAVTAVVGLVKGFSSKKLIGSGLELGIADGLLTGGTYSKIKKSSFWGLSSSTSTNRTAFDEETRTELEKQIGKVQDAVRDSFTLAGLSVTDAMIEGVDYAVQQIDTRDLSEDEIAEKVTEWFEGYADAIAEAIGDVSFDQLQTFASLKTMLEPLGQSFIGTFTAMAEAAEDLSDIAGGVDTLSSQLSSFVSTFYTDAEQLQIASDTLQTQFDLLGLAVPDTAKAFRELVMSQDLMTESGRETYVALLSLSDLFAEVEGGISDLTGSFDLGSYYASEFDAKLAAIAEARGYSADALAYGDAGVTLATSLQSLSQGDAAQTTAIRRLVTLLEKWDATGTPDVREF